MYVCQNCGFSTPKWLGRCPNCESWNSLIYEEEKKKKRKSKIEENKDSIISDIRQPQRIDEIKQDYEERIKTQISELDRVLGGGIVKGSVILFGGEPGVGKSTLLLQSALKISEKSTVLYVSSEESHIQIASRIKRVAGQEGENSIKNKNLYLLFENNLENTFSYARKIFRSGDKKGGILILDAVQSFFSDNIESSAGTISQVREVALKSVEFARETGIPVMLIGHVTKEGIVAGPKALEHIVDVVIYLEAEGFLRFLRATKNRFGSTGELGIFTMTEKGLEEINDPSTAFLDEDILNFPGVCLSAILEGTRVYILEVQALVSKTYFSVPRRSSQGYDIMRLSTLLAVLEKFAGISFWDKDVFLNIVGGIKVYDVSCDLAVALSIISSYFEIPLGKLAAIGEVGLLGEIRAPTFLDRRISEIRRIRPDKIILGKIKGNFSYLRSDPDIVSFPSIRELADYIRKLKKT
jgi:DNA repair protein RadA/Sms